MSRIHRPPVKVGAFLLFVVGLAFGIWLAYGTATGNIAYSQSRLIFEIIMLLTFVWMLIWTIRKRSQ